MLPSLLGLSKQSCTHCFGLGTINRRRRAKTSPLANWAVSNESPDFPCRCVLRSIFRICYEQYHHSAGLGVPVDQQQYAIDFDLVARRSLDPDDYKLFRAYHLLGQTRQSIKLTGSASAFSAQRGRIEVALGAAYVSLKPHALYPVDDYFHRRYDSRTAMAS